MPTPTRTAYHWGPILAAAVVLHQNADPNRLTRSTA